MANSVEFNLPGSSFEEVRKIVHAYSSFSTKVGLDEVAKVSGINSTIISKSAKFLVDIGVLSSGAQKVATDLGRKLGRAIEHKVVDDERIYWSDCVKSNEKVSKLITTIRIKGGMTEKAFSDHVLYVSGSKSTSGNKTGARCMTDILVASGLVLEADGKLNVATGPISPISADELGAAVVRSHDQAHDISNAGEVEARSPDRQNVQVPNPVVQGPLTQSGPQISINIQLQLPEAKDPDTYNQIFKALRDNLFP